MNRFTHETNGYEQFPVYRALKDFFDSYLINRDYEKTISLLGDDFYGLGVHENSAVESKEEFASLLKAELKAMPKAIDYKISSVCGKELADTIWNVMAVIEMQDVTIQLTSCIELCNSGYTINSIHLSETGNSIEKKSKDQLVFEIISESMPGGIVIGYAQEGYPLYFANGRYLELLGYSSYEEYYEDANGLGIANIHTDDLDVVNREIMESYSTGTQFGIEYRIRHKDGHYISVYDIGKKMIMPDGKEVIICVLYDMTEDVRMKEILIRESSYDALTGVYNRGGGMRTITNELKDADKYSFIFFDVDNLKLLNDKYNHEAGDHALKYFSELLMEYFVEETILVRMGGDEFIAFLDDTMKLQKLQRIFTILEQEYCSFIDNIYPESHSSVSIGCVVGTRKCDFEELYRITDELMYDIKKHGKKGYKIVELN